MSAVPGKSKGQKKIVLSYLLMVQQVWQYLTSLTFKIKPFVSVTKLLRIHSKKIIFKTRSVLYMDCSVEHYNILSFLSSMRCFPRMNLAQAHTKAPCLKESFPYTHPLGNSFTKVFLITFSFKESIKLYYCAQNAGFVLIFKRSPDNSDGVCHLRTTVSEILRYKRTGFYIK